MFNKLISQGCDHLNSNQPCGILKGLYSDTSIGGTYGFYGAEKEGTWKAISGPQLFSVFSSGPGSGKYKKVGDYLMATCGFVKMPANIFITNQVTANNPYGTGYKVWNNVVTFSPTQA